MIIKRFTKEYAQEARALARANYEEERMYVPALPADIEIPPAESLPENDLGVVALSNDRVVGFIAAYGPWEGMLDTYDELGVFSPVHCHGAVKENRSRIYQDMYAYMGDVLYKRNILGLGIALYAHDTDAKNAFFEYGFGMRCKDRIRPVSDKIPIRNRDMIEAGTLSFEELELKEFRLLTGYREKLKDHLKESPCFMQVSKEDHAKFIQRVLKGDRRTFIAKVNGEIAAYIDIADSAETFVSDHPKMANIQGAYCDPSYRGMGIYSDLLAYVNSKMDEEGFVYLGVDHESYNPAANRFWPKYFAEYTNSVTRKVENWSVGK